MIWKDPETERTFFKNLLEPNNRRSSLCGPTQADMKASEAYSSRIKQNSTESSRGLKEPRSKQDQKKVQSGLVSKIDVVSHILLRH